MRTLLWGVFIVLGSIFAVGSGAVLVACEMMSEESAKSSGFDVNEQVVGHAGARSVDQVVYRMTYQSPQSIKDIEVIVTEQEAFGPRTARWRTWTQTGVLDGAHLAIDYEIGPEHELKLMGIYTDQPLFVAGDDLGMIYLYLGAERVGPKVQEDFPIDGSIEYRLDEFGVFHIVLHQRNGEQVLMYAETFGRLSYIRQANRTTPRFVFYWGDQPLRDEPLGCSDLFTTERLLGVKGEPIGFRYTCDDQIDQLLPGPGYQFPLDETYILDWSMADYQVE